MASWLGWASEWIDTFINGGVHRLPVYDGEVNAETRAKLDRLRYVADFCEDKLRPLAVEVRDEVVEMLRNPDAYTPEQRDRITERAQDMRDRIERIKQIVTVTTDAIHTAADTEVQNLQTLSSL